MRATIISGTLSMALTITAAAGAEDKNSANFMLPSCKALVDNTPASNFRQGQCQGMVAAIVFMATNSELGVTAFSGVRGLEKKPRCADLPRGVTNGQMVRVVIRYIEERPTRMHELFMGLALEAILDVWPCRS